MSARNATAMDGLAIAEFLETQRTGVLSLAREGDGYAIPVSFVYDDDGPALYFRLGFAPGSQKRRYIDATEHATFVVYDEADAGWKSVVAEGRLEERSKTTLDSSVVEAIECLDIPFFSVFERPANDLEFGVVRLAITKLNGIAEAGSG